MRIAATLFKEPLISKKDFHRLHEYYSEELEAVFTQARKAGLAPLVYEEYIEALQNLKRGNFNRFRQLLSIIKRKIESEREPYIGFNEPPNFPCTDCVLLVFKEDMELFFRVNEKNLKSGVYKIYLSYDRRGRFQPLGLLIKMENLLEFYSKGRFIAAA